MLRPSLKLLILGSVAGMMVSPCMAEAPAQSGAAKECLRLDAKPADSIPWDEHERVYKQWVEVCRQAMATDAGDIRVKKATARALGTTGQRAEEIVLLREMAAQNDAGAAFEIYDMYKSYFRNDVNKPQLVKRAEAEQGLRKAAELGDAYAILMLAVLLDRGDIVKRDNADAIRWAERAVSNPAKDRKSKRYAGLARPLVDQIRRSRPKGAGARIA